LCSQLQKKPAVEGNQKQVLKHKKDLLTAAQEGIEEMMANLSFGAFNKSIQD